MITGDLSWATKSELLTVICDEISKYTVLPTKYQRYIFAQQLVQQFPSLKSNIGEGHEGWSLKIYDKMKRYPVKKKTFHKKRKCSDKEKKST